MIYTVTFNPSLDYIVDVEQFRLGCTNRSEREYMMPGGKGINVSIVLRNLGFDNVALGFVGGFVGEEIIRRLEEAGVATSFLSLSEGISRINVKLRSVEGTEINACGPVIPKESVEALFRRLDALEAGDVLVLAGSIPTSMPDTMYQKILERCADKKILTAVDATGRLLTNVLAYRPFLIKPNVQELCEIFGVQIDTQEQIVHYAKELQRQGAVNVLVSMAGDGAVCVAENGEVYRSKAPEGTLVNGVGAGDSMVAGFLAGFLEQRDYRHAFLMGVATGSASAFSKGFATREQVEALYGQLA